MEHVSEILPAIARTKGIRKSDLKLIEAAAAIRQAPPDSDDYAFMAKELVQCTLPHRDPGNIARWSRVNGALTLTIVSTVGYPYGSIPRLLLFWLTREAKRTQSRKIKLGDSFYGFLKELGFNSYNGTGVRSDSKRVREQIRRLFASMISFSTGNDSTTERRLNMVVADASELWWGAVKPEQAELWESWVLLGEKFYRAITASPIPLDCRALKALKRSPLALDLYAWVIHKVYSVRKKGSPQFVSWAGLHAQFGSDYSTMKNFQIKAVAALTKIRVVYPELKLKFVPGGLIVGPSRLAIPAKA
jgi:hypothetical protein